MEIRTPEKVDFIINKLMEHGYEAYAVGGCVRDSILGRVPGDWDITTSASPYEVKQIFHRTIDTGIEHGTVTVMLDKDGFEVTTYRLDGEYEDCRHPKQVEFTKSLREDLKRRDFTINAMAYNKQDGMVDLFEGLEDIDRGVIRCVGSAMERFEEDALRILRAIRFSAQLDFDIEEETKQAIERKAGNLVNISAERIREELNKLFLSMHPDKLAMAYEMGITKVVLPELDQKMKLIWNQGGEKTTFGEHILQELSECSKIAGQTHKMLDMEQYEMVQRTLTNKEHLCLSYALLLKGVLENGTEESCELDAKNAKKVMQRLKFDNNTINVVTHLVKYSSYPMKADDWSIRTAMNLFGTQLCDLWFLFQWIQVKLLSGESAAERAAVLKECYDRYVKIIERKECVNLKMLQMNGKELIELGVKPGVKIGETLNLLLLHVLKDPQDNTNEVLKREAKKLIEQQSE